MNSPRPPALPPSTSKEGAARIHTLLVKLFDAHDGKGADWPLMLKSLYRLGFKLADDQLDDAARLSLMRKVYEGAELRLTGGYADGSGPSNTIDADVESMPSNSASFKSPTPKPPR